MLNTKWNLCGPDYMDERYSKTVSKFDSLYVNVQGKKFRETIKEMRNPEEFVHLLIFPG